MKNDMCAKDGGERQREAGRGAPRTNDTAARKMQDSRNTIYYLNTPQIFHFSPGSQRWIALASLTVQYSCYHCTDSHCPVALCSGPVRFISNPLADTVDKVSI
jgi:hypothetical protein